jgi:cyanophycin synthetase
MSKPQAKQKPEDLSISARLIYQEAQQRGVDCIIFDKNTILMKDSNKNWYIRGSRTSWQSSVGRTIARRKELTKTILNYYKIPQAKHKVIKNPDKIKTIQKLNFPLVLKPSQGHHGDNVFVGLEDIEEAKEKISEIYFDEDNFAIFEEMLQGKEFRILCIDFKFVAAAYRIPANVTGDGEHPIQELIDQKNQHPWRAEGHQSPLTKIEVDEVVKQNLAEQNLNLASVLEKNQQVFLRKTANLSTGGEAVNVTDQVSQANQKLFERIAKICDLNIIGIDVMCQSLQNPIIDQKNAGIIEVNASPGLRMHHFPMKGKAVNAASLILDMIKKNLTR